MRSNDIELTPVDSDIKDAFAKVCRDAGLTPREALTLFTESVVEQGDIPFHLKAKQLESRMYGGRPDQIQLPKEEPKESDMFMADSENRFFNELMGI
jgi:addiction module RelB/DinJ family antitoxin